MSGFDVKQARFGKVRGDLDLEAAEQVSGTVEAIVKVNEDNYVPPGVKVRARIDPTMLTGEIPTSLLPELEGNPKVASVSVSRRLRIID